MLICLQSRMAHFDAMATGCWPPARPSERYIIAFPPALQQNHAAKGNLPQLFIIHGLFSQGRRAAQSIQ